MGDLQELWDVFHDGTMSEYRKLQTSNAYIAHYTSADTAIKIIENECFWLSSCELMNDSSEVEYSTDLMRDAWDGEFGGRFKGVVEAFHPRSGELLEKWMQNAFTRSRSQIFISSFSVHKRNDNLGRLSMWRAYAPENGVALIFENDLMDLYTLSRSGVYASKVLYEDRNGFREQLENLISRLEHSLSDVVSKYYGPFYGEISSNFAKDILLFMCYSMKHPAFSEEREWRFIYDNTGKEEGILKPKLVTKGRMPQLIYELPIGNIKDRLAKVIVGPSVHPEIIKSAISHAMKKVGSTDADERIICPNIPLRSTR